MEKKEPTTSNSTGVCEKLFNAFSPTFRPIRRLTFGRQDPTDVTNPTPTVPSANGGAKPGPVTMPHEKAKATPATTNVKAEPGPSPGRDKAHNKVMTAPAPPPQPNTVPKPQPLAAPPLPKPQPPPRGAAPERSKTNINEKVGDYIARVRAKIRTSSGVGRTPTS